MLQETVTTHIRGTNSAEVSTAEIIDTIAELEGQIESLNSMKTDSAAKDKLVVKLQDDIKKLVEIADSRV